MQKSERAQFQGQGEVTWWQLDAAVIVNIWKLSCDMIADLHIAVVRLMLEKATKVRSYGYKIHWKKYLIFIHIIQKEEIFIRDLKNA